MLCTLVIAIGTFPYALRAVATPWSLDQVNLHHYADVCGRMMTHRQMEDILRSILTLVQEKRIPPLEVQKHLLSVPLTSTKVLPYEYKSTCFRLL
jgi:hypothetical protein